jgi:hypothetical protein
MSPAGLFKKLGAPLANVRWSWGSVRASDNIVFLRVWQDEGVKSGDKFIVQLTHNATPRDEVDEMGHQERLKHIQLVRDGARCYLLLCRAVDNKAVPRSAKSVIEKEVFPTGEMQEIEGDIWIEMKTRVPISDVLPS